MKLIARVNHGRWLVTCPKCGSRLTVAPSDKSVVCAVCHPGLRAEVFAPHPKKAGLFVQVPDFDARQEARAQAKKAGEEYEILFQEKPAEVEKLLRGRPMANRNWLPEQGETLNDLKRENKEHKVRA